MGTTEIVLVHHTDCGMAKFTDADLNRQVQAETGAQPPFRWGAVASVESGLRDALAAVRSSPFIPERTHVRGFMLDLDSGRLQEVT